MNSLKKMLITDANAAAVSNRLKNITADRKFLNKHDVVLTLDILEKVVDKRNTSGEVSLFGEHVFALYERLDDYFTLLR